MATTATSVVQICQAAQLAARQLARADSATKDAALSAIADALVARTPEILLANERDMDAEFGYWLSGPHSQVVLNGAEGGVSGRWPRTWELM